MDIEAGVKQSDGPITPLIIPLDDDGPILHIREQEAIDYYLSRIDYFDPGFHVAASRIISMVTPGSRTRSAYLTQEATTKILQIHMGAGFLILGNPIDRNNEDSDEDFATTIYPLNPDITPAITIPPDHFYSLEAASWSHEPLIVSEVKDVNGKPTSSTVEIEVESGQQVVDTPNGSIDIPEEFATGIFN
jgi:hypothetical protein